MRSAMKRSSLREIWSSFGRYFAILAIVALGVGFFSGVRITTPAMVSTMDHFTSKRNLFDFRLVSSYGWNDDDVKYFSEQEEVKYAEGAYSADAMFDHGKHKGDVYRIHSMPENVNKLRIISGRMPKAPDECVIDSHVKDGAGISQYMRLSPDNPEKNLESFTTDKFKVVGIVDSPLYINFERGSTSLGNGSVTGFIYVLSASFSAERYNDIYMCFDRSFHIYSSAYDRFIGNRTEKWEGIVNERAQYSKTQMLNGSDGSTAGRPDAVTYVLGRNTNIGYTCFESDSEIVEQVAKVFPVLFILVAALVCMTTMSRMVEEQRTQIGIFKALGYSNASIMARFMFYSGSAAAIGCIAGYAGGTYLFPKVIWQTYKMMYVRLKLDYVFSPSLAASTLILSLAGSLGITYITCRYELAESAASLMRPKAPRAGKRVLLERIPFIWNRMKFLHKVSVRNIFRYKKRFFMMITGISGCTALLVTGFGIKDSIAGFADVQYRKIITADASLVYKNPENEDIPASLKNRLDENTEEYTLIHESSWEMTFGSKVKSITLDAPQDPEKMQHFMNFRTIGGTKLDMPEKGEALISNSLHDRYGINVGDSISLRDEEMHTIYVEISGIFENHVYNYVFISPETLETQTNSAVKYNTVYMNFSEDSDHSDAYTAITKDSNIVSHTLFSSLRERMTKMMDSLNYIVVVVIICAAGLAFIVLYNLTNINITERLREIATIKVLGFFKSETSAYVLRENLVLTALGSGLGMILGVFLHRFVMKQIVVDLVSFSVDIKPMSFVYSIVLTFIFNALVNLFMQFKLDRISMTESLKSVE